MHDVVTKSLTQTADRIVTREVRGEEKEVIRVPISSTAQDRDGDVFAPEALSGMRDQIEREQPLVFQNHGFTAFDKPLYDQRESIGTQIDAEVEGGKADGEDATLFAFILPDTTHPEGDRLREQVKQGQAPKFSVGFRVKDAEPLNPEAENDERQRFIDTDLMETSKVGIPSNPEASASVAAKAAHVTEALSAAGMDIDDEEAFAKALASELVSRDSTPDPATIDGVRRKDATKGPCDDNGDCPDGEVCVDGECVPEDEVGDDEEEEDSVTETDDFIMDDEAEERFASLEQTIDERFASLEDTITNALTDEGEQPDDDPVAELDGLDDEQREEVRALLDKMDGDTEPAESETKTPDPSDATDPDEEKDGGDADGHVYPEDVRA